MGFQHFNRPPSMHGVRVLPDIRRPKVHSTRVVSGSFSSASVNDLSRCGKSSQYRVYCGTLRKEVLFENAPLLVCRQRTWAVQCTLSTSPNDIKSSTLQNSWGPGAKPMFSSRRRRPRDKFTVILSCGYQDLYCGIRYRTLLLSTSTHTYIVLCSIRQGAMAATNMVLVMLNPG